jgi:hypothetical protein
LIITRCLNVAIIDDQQAVFMPMCSIRITQWIIGKVQQACTVGLYIVDSNLVLSDCDLMRLTGGFCPESRINKG